ncbi:stAR-related lipid transfer protein 9 [Brienomyrus brachyistius]|uniref:stAR-related lipid transfer protein 9 n=1 Tax=Brienomyrus brachyistius TaxID=42636 RepID=UPI0020B34788|nr:stAR-related lipid transfer protein 9 [Brienomyrus brachyistius]
MSNVQVAIRVRPLNARETTDGARIALQVEDKIVRIKNMKLDGRPDGHGDSREKLMEFGFDYCYWSVDPEGPNHASQEEVFQDLGVSVLTGASEGYNVCLFAYGQTGSGKTYTMIGTPASIGLTPRICQGLFRTDGSFPEGQSSSRVEISFLEIYNERVRDLLKHSKQKKPTTLRVREHPEKGPYVQGLSQYVVSDYKQAVDLLETGIANRITAATHVHDASSRSHAIFSIQYTQAILENSLPSEIVSKINLVDLAGSERADPHYCRDRITEGSNINKSLVTLGIVISALAQNSQMFSSCQSINSTASEGEGSVAGSQCSSYSGAGRRQCFIPYRDSILTWLLKDSLGGNSKTIMIATISPSCSSYSETLSTLRYAAHARNIVNKPRVNEDANVKLIRELREEINRLKSMLLSFKMQRNPSPSLSEDRDGNLSDIVLQNELKVEQLTKDWTDHWHDKKELLEQYSVDINRDRAGFLIRSLLPHLIALDRDVLSTGVTFYHLREGVTKIGPQDQREEPQIVLQGEAQCEIVNQCGMVTLRPFPGSVCMVNGREVTEPCQLAQGAVITLGEVHKFRFNHPAEAALLRERRRASGGMLSCSMSDLSSLTPRPSEKEEECWEQGGGKKGAVPRQRVQEQQRYVQSLREEIQVEQQWAERDLEREQAYLRQQQREIQQWALQERQRLSANERKTEESEAQTELVFKILKGGVRDTGVGDRKRVVQEELLRHHALRRAENRVRRKRLHYQLERIARKRHLLEAKRELQCLECALSPDSSSSSEPGLPAKTKGSSYVLRRHSFSADLLSRLYPKHNPLFSHIIRRNKRMRNRANTLPTGNRSLEGKTISLESLKAGLLHPDQLNRGLYKRKLSFTNINVIKSGKEELQQTDSSELHGKDNKETPSTASKLNTPYSPPKICKSSSKGSKSLERIRKVFSQSAGPGIRTALSKFFCKPPSGFIGNKGNQSTSTSQFQGNKGDVNVDAKTEQRPWNISLGQRGWYSEEALNKALVEQAREKPTCVQSVDNRKGEEEEVSSDCDSSFSLDSLSSAYTKALAEQLRHEEFEDGNNSELESVNSQISQDSLVMENSSKANTMRLNSKPSLSSHCYSQVNEKTFLTEEIDNEMFSSLEPCASDEMPAEAFWNLKGFHMPKAGNKKESKMELDSEPQLKAKSAALLLESKATEEQEGGPLLGANSSTQFSWSSAKETENLCVLTDAWSSTEPSDSPSINSGSMAVSRSREIHPVCSISLQNSTDVFESISDSETPTIHTNDSKDATLFQQEYWDSESENTQVVGMLEDHKITSSIAAMNSTIKESVYSEGGNLEECSEFVPGMKGGVEDSATLEKSGMQKNDDEMERLCFRTDMCKPVVVAPLLRKSHCFLSEGEPRTFNNMETFPNDRSLDTECVGADKSISQDRASGFLCRNTYSTSEDKFLNVKNAGAEGQQMDGIDSAVGSQSVIMSTCDTDRSGCHEITVPPNLPLFRKVYSDPIPKRIIDFNEVSVVNTMGLPFSKVVEDTLLNESELKGSSSHSCQAMGSTTEDMKVKTAAILKTQDSDTMLNGSQGTSQTLLSTETVFESKNLKVLSKNAKETLNFPVSSECYRNEGKCTGSIAEGLSADRSSCNESDNQTYLKGNQWAVLCDENKDYSVKTTSKACKLGVITECLKQGISQNIYSLKVHKTLKTYYRCKDFKRRKLKLGFCYTATKYRRKKKAQNKTCDYQEKTGRQKSFQKTQSNHLPFSEFFEVSTPTHQSPTNLVDIKNANHITVMYDGLKSCKKCISAESVDVSVGKDEEPAHNRETVTVKQTTDIQERIKELLEYSGRGNAEESDPSPVDQKISEVVKEHMQVTIKEFEESSNSDEFVYEATATKMEMDQKKSLLLEQMSLNDMVKPVFAVNIATSPSKNISLTSTNCNKTEATSVISDVSQTNAFNTQIQHCSPDRELDRPGMNSGASLHNIMKQKCTAMDNTDDMQIVSESNKISSSTEMSSPANDPVIDVFRNQQVTKHYEANHIQEEATLECCRAECQSIRRHKIDLGLRLDSVNQESSKQNVEKHNIRSSTCLFENCHENDLSRHVHFRKPAIQTEVDNLRNTYASTVASPITQLKDDQRNSSFHHAEHTSKSCLKRSQSMLNGLGTEDCDVLPKSHKQALQSHTSMDIHIKPLLPSAKISNAKMNLHENISSIDSQTLDGQITQNCRLNFLEEQLCNEDSPQKVSSKYLCSAGSQSKDGSEIILSKEISGEGDKKFHKRSCKLVDFTKAFKQERIQEYLTESKESGEGSFQMLCLKSEDSKEETCKVGTNSPAPALQSIQEDTIHQTKDFEFYLNFLQSYPSPTNRSTQLTSIYTGDDCCMEVNNESKPLSSFATCTLSQDYYQQDCDIFDIPKDGDSTLDDINPSDKTSTSSSDLKDLRKQLQDNKACQAKTRQKGKLKKLSRLNARTTTTSSSDSSANFSSEEVVGRSARYKTSPDNQIQCKQEVLVKNKSTCKDHSKDWIAHSSSHSLSFLQNDGSKKELGETLNHKSSTLCTERKDRDISKRRHGEKKFQEEDTEKTNPAEESKSDCIQKTSTQKTPKHYSSHLAPKGMAQDQQNFQKMDTTIHFTSSDVNPFIHSWQDSATQRQRKVFGSAADISNKTPELNGAGNRAARCCSVDNGLNVQSCPFYSHLSTFAKKKTLSSTLSSIEGCKEQSSSECQYASNALLKVHVGSYDSYCSDISRNPGNSSDQVDEKMLVCPSEEESSDAVHKEYPVLTCNQCTQTSVPDRKQKKINHQRRSRTETQRSSMGAEDKDMASTLANLQNMSLHLSQLIYNTSGLLGNMEAMDASHVTVNSRTSSSSKFSMQRDCSTQTAVDVEIQTDSIIKPVGSKNMQTEQQIEETLKPQEVNVIVKVVGAETVSISPEKEDFTLPVQGRTFKKNTAQEMTTLPNLSGCSDGSQTAMEIGLPKVQASTSSLKDEVVFQSFSHLKSLAQIDIPRQSFCTSLGDTKMRGSLVQTTGLKNETPRKDNAFHHVTKRVYVTDRASSPILTVEAGVAQMLRSKSSQSLGNCQMSGMQEPMKELVLEHINSLSPTANKFQKQKEQCFSYKQARILGERSQYGDQLIESSGNRYISSVSLENIKSLNYNPLNKILQNDTCDRIKDQLENVGCGVPKPLSMQSATQCPRLSHSSLHSKIHQASSAIPAQRNDPLFDRKLEESYNRQQIYILDKELSFDNHTLKNHQKEVNNTGNDLRKPEPFVREGTVRLQEDDAVSLMASECDTDILINTRPLVDEVEKEYLRIPEDLPLHNKFTNWSGVNCWPPSSPSSSLSQLARVTSRQEMKGSHSDLGCSESPKTETTMVIDSRLREIERLRQEREQVMATVRLDMNPRPLTVELTEAKLHYGLGETDALLKLMKSGSVEEACGVPTKQQLYDRHRHSIEGLRQEREARLQSCRRARSLSPSKPTSGRRSELPVGAAELPSQRRDHLQKLRQAVVTSSRLTVPPRQTGECPSEIELLLKDYGRAREVAKSEIARARDRLRERTRQEKRRLHQQALSQLVKDDLRFRTRVSSSTLCTGSSLSLSSGHTSGYNSSNTARIQEGSRPSCPLQICEPSEDGRVKVRGCPPKNVSLGVDPHRSWASAQDVCVEAAVNKSDPQLLSTSHPRGHHCSLSFSSMPSKPPAYQDIAASTLSSAIAEIYSAGNGDLKNLLDGKASSGWRHQGAERGVQAFYKPSSSPSMHSFLGAAELQRPLASLWCMIRDHSKAHLYHGSVHSTRTRTLDSSTELVYLLTDVSSCHLVQPRDFCCISKESKQDWGWVLAVRSLCETSLLPPSAEAVRGELFPSAWLLQPSPQDGRELVRVFYLLQVDLKTAALSPRLLSSVAKKQAAVISELDDFFSI